MYFYFLVVKWTDDFFLSSLDYCANCQAASCPSVPSGCLHPIDSRLLTVKFNCPAPAPPGPSGSSEGPTCMHISRDCRDKPSWQALLELASCGGRVGVGTFAEARESSGSSVLYMQCNVQQSATLMILNQDYFPGGEGTLFSFGEWEV